MGTLQSSIFFLIRLCRYASRQFVRKRRESEVTFQLFHFSGDIHFLPGFIRTGVLSDRTADQRNRGSQGSRCFRPEDRDDVIERIFKMGAHRQHDRLASGLLFYVQMASELCLQNGYKNMDIFAVRSSGIHYRPADGQLSNHQSGKRKSCGFSAV